MGRHSLLQPRRKEEKSPLADRIFPYWFYPMFLVALACSVWIGYAMVSVFWEIIKIVFNWLVAR